LLRSIMATVLPAAENRAANGGPAWARPDDDGVEPRHAASAPSMLSFASLAASSGVLPF
jgi:hypothetical protein